jgi:hypothetical protein
MSKHKRQRKSIGGGTRGYGPAESRLQKIKKRHGDTRRATLGNAQAYRHIQAKNAREVMLPIFFFLFDFGGLDAEAGLEAADLGLKCPHLELELQVSGTLGGGRGRVGGGGGGGNHGWGCPRE